MNGEALLEQIRLSGKDILWVRSFDGEEQDLATVSRLSKNRQDFESELCKRLAIPERLCRISYATSEVPPLRLKVPVSWTVAVRLNEP